jgi:hypothetical protein
MAMNFSIASLTGDETWALYVNVETKEQLKQLIHTHSPNKPKNFKQTLTARKLMATLATSGTGKEC